MNNETEFNVDFYGHEEPDDYGDASDGNEAGDARNKRAEEFAALMLLLFVKASLFFIIQYCEEKGYNTTLFEIIQF